ncbi:MAG: glycerate kinase, partial [Streptosporangiales bacterium]|nr:glycerate kinase [Streptosporangiales bacterium]
MRPPPWPSTSPRSSAPPSPDSRAYACRSAFRGRGAGARSWGLRGVGSGWFGWKEAAVFVVVAPDSFKGCLTAAEAAAAIAGGVRRALPGVEVREVPMADGGEGTLDCFVDALGAERMRMTATGPLGAPVEATYAIAGPQAVVELASASGLPLIPVADLDAPRATTHGTGDLIRAAIDGGARDVLLCLGGSATTDGGTGLMRALGYRFLDADGRDLPEGGGPLTGLEAIDDADVPAEVRAVRFRLACDVAHPLVGPSGAAAVFGPQKGADAEQVELLDAALTRLADVLADTYGPRVHDLPGAGAAGGTPAGLVAALGAEMAPGGRLVAETVGLPEALADRPDLVLTG